MKAKLDIIGNFTEDPTAVYSGLRDLSLPAGISRHLSEYFSIEEYDVGNFPHNECGISKLIGEGDRNLFIIQNKVNFRIDVPNLNIFYFHIDGQQTINPTYITYAFYLFNAIGIHDYKVNERQKVILPFVFMEYFDPNREKDTHLSDIPRELPFREYKEQLEYSHFTIVDAINYISKRALEALACKTIPIIITTVPEMYYRMGFEDSFCCLVSTPSSASRIDRQEYDIEKGYKWVKENHSAKVRIKQLIPFMKIILNK